MPYAAALSTATDTQQAIREAADEALARLGTVPELAVAFFTPHHADPNPSFAAGLAGRLKAKCLIGCSAESVAGTGREVERSPALAVWLADFGGRVQLETFHLQAGHTPDGPSVLGWPDALIDTDVSNATALVLGDPYSFPTADLFLPRVNEDYPGLAVLGGMASGAAGPGQNVLIRDDQTARVGAVGVLLRGPKCWRHVVSQGCRPIGRPMVITKGDQHVIQEIGGQKPLDYLRALYKELPQSDQKLFEQGLHVGLVMSEYRESFGRGDFLVRNLYGIDRNTGAVVVTDFIRVGQTVQFQLRDADTADEDLTQMLAASVADGKKPGGALLFTCNGRGTRMFKEPHHDAGVIQGVCGPVPMAGFFAAGEFGPVGETNFIHGFTASVVLFEE